MSLANTQPFIRELGGRTHVFAHNGDLPGIYRSETLALGVQRPIGQTDSEHAFCALLSRLNGLWGASQPPSLQARLSLLSAFSAELRALGPANFLYSDGDALFAHGHRRLQAPSGRAGPPGLWVHQRRCPPADPMSSSLNGVAVSQGDRAVVWVASVPVTREEWRPLQEGELIAVQAGELIASSSARLVTADCSWPTF